MTTIKVLRGNTSSIANYAGQAGEVALNSDSGNLVFWTNTANVYYTFGVAAGGTPAAVGSTSGYVSGGQPGSIDRIEKYDFSSGGSTTDIAELFDGVNGAGGASSSTHGYVLGGNAPGDRDHIQKFSFLSDSPATDIAELTQARLYITGTESSTHGYAMGGYTPTVDILEKFPFSSDSPATDVANVNNWAGPQSYGSYDGAGAASTTHGYYAGGFSSAPPSYTEGLGKFPFASDTDMSKVADMYSNRGGSAEAGANSETHGYQYAYGLIQKWDFASDTDAVLAGNTLHPVSVYGYTCQSSTTHGHAAGGRWAAPAGGPAAGYVETLHRWSFSSDSDSTDFGETIGETGFRTGNQV